MMRRGFLSSSVCNARNVRQLITSGVRNSEADIQKSVNSSSENANAHNTNDEHKIEQPHHDYIHTTNFQRLILSIGSSVAALVNPHR